MNSHFFIWSHLRYVSKGFCVGGTKGTQEARIVSELKVCQIIYVFFSNPRFRHWCVANVCGGRALAL